LSTGTCTQRSLISGNSTAILSLITTMSAPASQVDFKGLLALLVKDPSSFTPGHLTQCFALIFTPTPESSEIPPTQLSAFLTALHITHLDHRPEFLAAAASFLKGLWIKADVEGYKEDFVVDIVGTGGDGHDTFNVSTTAAIVAAGAGARVCKVCASPYIFL